MKKRLLSLFLCLCTLITMLPATVYASQGDSLTTIVQATSGKTENPFTDVKESDWFYSSVQYAREKGFFAGTSKTTFSPNGTMTRSMFVTVLGRMAGVNTEVYKGNSAFSDVPMNSYYAPYVAWAAKYGITSGVGNGKFAPDEPITRQQMAAFFIRYFGLFGVEYETDTNITTFPQDMDKVAAYARDAVLKLWKTGLLAGDGVNFDPSGYATRAQCAALCMRTDRIVKTWYQEPGVPKEEIPVVVPPSGGSYSGGGSSGGNTTTYYKVEFMLGGEDDPDVTLPEAKTYTSGTAITTLPTPFKQNSVFLGWYYDKEMTQRVESGDTVTGNMTLYAKMADSDTELDEGGTPDYVSSVDVNPESFYIKLTNNATKATIKVINISDGNSDITNDVTVSAGEVRCDWKAGQTYQLEVLDSNARILFNEEEQNPAIRYYNFTTAKEPVLNLELNDDLIFIPSSDVTGMPEDTPSGLYSATLKSGRGMLKAETGSGSFTYTGEESITVGDTVAIYSGEKPTEQTGAAGESGDVAYLTITGVSGNTYSYTVADAEDVLFVPDVLPINTGEDQITDDGCILTVNSMTLDFSDDKYMELGLDSQTAVDVGDFIAFYTGEYDGGGHVTEYARVTGVSWNSENTVCTITYENVDISVVLAAMDAYGTKNQEIEISNEDKERIEKEIEEQAWESGFVHEASHYLAALALETDGFKTLSRNMDLKSYSFTIDDGTALKRGSITAKDSSKVKIEGLDVNANISKNLKHFNGSSGIRAALNVSFTIIVGPESDNQIEIAVQAIFEQEVLLDLNISGDAIWKWAWIIPYIYDYRINTNFDVGTYTGVGITATVLSKSKEDEWDWDEFDNIESIGLQIQNLMKEKERFLGKDVDTVGGGLAEKYARMLENESDWVELVSVKLFKTEARVLLGIVVVGVSLDFVVAANVNITVGMSFEYATAKRYNFSLMIFHKKSSSNTINLEPEHYQFDLYAMGTLGLRAGIRLEIYAGLFAKDFASIGITAETGAYAQLWGYFYYSLYWDGETKEKTTSYSGAMLVEVGIYLEVSFLASAFGGTFEYNPTIYENTWPLWHAGARENILDFAEVKDSDLNYDIRIVKSFSLPTSVFDMRYMDLTSGEVYGEKEEDGSWRKDEGGDELPAINYDADAEDRFIISISDPRFAYDPGTNTVSISPNEGDVSINAEMTITWKGGPLAFSSKPITRTIKIRWSDPKNARFIAFNSNGGSTVQMISASPNANITWPENPTKQGYIFDGWYTEKELFNKYNPVAKMPAFTEENKGITLYAKWLEAPNSYTVNVYQQALNGTYELVRSGVINKDKSNSSIKTNGMANWHLTNDGWTTPATGFTYNEAATDKNVTITANGSTVVNVFFDRKNGTVTFNYGKLKVEGSDDTKDILYTYKYGATIYVPNIVIGGYTFKGWADGSGNMVSFDNMTMGTANKTYYAQWEPDTNTPYRVEYYVQDTEDDAWYYNSAVPGTGTTDTVVNLASYLNLGTGLKLGKVTVDGTEITDFTDSDEDSLLKIKGNGKLIIKIYYNREIKIVSFLNTVGGMPSQNVRYGGRAIKPADPQKVGYTFTHWCTDEACTNDSKCANAWNFDTVITSDLQLYAVWATNKDTAYKVEYYEMGVDGSYPATATRTVNKTGETNADGTAETSGSVIPDGFALDIENEKNSLTDKIAADGSLVLKVYLSRNKYNLTFDANGGTGGTSTSAYHGEPIIPPAVSREGYNFSVWSPEPAAFMPIGDTTYQAQWTGWNYTVKFDPNVPEGIIAHPGTMADQGGFVYGTKKMLNKVEYDLPATGYTFIGWDTDKDDVDKGKFEYNDEAEIDIMPAQNDGTVTLYAVWKQGEPTEYKVLHSFMNLDGVTYTVDNEKTQPGIIGATTNAVPLTVEGFTAQPVTQKIIEEGTTEVTISYTRNKYNLTWNFEGGTATNEGSFTSGTVYYDFDIILPVLTKTAHSYVWNEIPAAKMPASDKTYTAKWTPNSYTVTIIDSGTDGTVTGTHSFGASVTLNPGTKSGHKFIGWTVVSGGVTIDDNSFTMPDNAVEVRAEWERTQSTITWNLAGGTVFYDGEYTEGPVRMTDDTGNTVIELSSPTRIGYTFAGWDKAVPSEMPESDMTITAKWNPVTISLSFKEATLAEMQTSYKIYDEKVTGTTLQVNIPKPSKTGYTFRGWTRTSGNGTLSEYSGGDQTLTVEFGTSDATITLTAAWEANQYSFTLDLVGGTLDGDSGIGGRITKTHTYGQATNLSAFEPVKTGYEFLGWYDGVTMVTEIPANTEITNKEYTAKWTVKKHQLTIRNNPTGDTSEDVDYGTSIKLEPATPVGYNFKGWTVESPDGLVINGNNFSMPDDNVIVSANWEGKDVKIYWDTNGYGVEPFTTTQKVGEKLNMPELTEDQYEVVGWFMDVFLEKPYTSSDVPVTDAGSYTLYAKWDKRVITVTVVPGNGNNYTRKVDYGQPIGNLSAPSRPGYIFRGYYHESTMYHDKYGNSQDIPLYESVTLTAKWDCGFWVKNVLVDDTNKDSIPVDVGSASYDPATRTLTLNNVTINHTVNQNDERSGMIWVDEELASFTIQVVGNNTLTMGTGSKSYFGIYFKKTVTFKGNGTLKVDTSKVSDAAAIFVYSGEAIIDGCHVEAIGYLGNVAEPDADGMALNQGPLILTNGASLLAAGNDYAVTPHVIYSDGVYLKAGKENESLTVKWNRSTRSTDISKMQTRNDFNPNNGIHVFSTYITVN